MPNHHLEKCPIFQRREKDFRKSSRCLKGKNLGENVGKTVFDLALQEGLGNEGGQVNGAADQ